MIRTLLYIAGGILLGGVIHLVVILTLPLLAEETAWTRVAELDAQNRILVLEAPPPGEPNPLRLDPELLYGLCRIDLTDAPVYLRGTLPDAFWSVAIFDPAGVVTYATTNRDGIGRTVDLGIFNADQTRLLAQQQIDVEEGLLVVEAASNALFILLRLAPPQDAMRPRFAEALSGLSCGPQQ